MSVFRCKMCGGDLAVTNGATVFECEYCGTKQTVPAADDEKKVTLFNRANRLRFNNEFDKAAGIYESIVADFPEEAEAYWGLLLCKYGIEYVDDPATAKKIPTCHRSSFESIFDDTNFDLVMEYADMAARGIYREEAKAIEEIRKGIIEVSSKEEPYDIFICYKETDENGGRTLDSVLAQDVYDALLEKGYKVFFSRITLEDKLGQEYEPYIFAALSSAKVMLAFGTDFEYFNAVWVKNEWSRYLQMIAAGQKKTLIPCYKNIDAYDMPKEFARLQAQDMGKVGALQDLLRGIDKIVPSPKAQAQAASSAQQVTASATNATQLMLENGGMYEGEVFAGIPHGVGKCTYTDNSVYEGQWSRGKREGNGTLTRPNGTTLTGEWKDNKIWNGKGRYLYDNGFYDGEFTNGKLDGHGIRSWNDGNRYEGEFKDNKRNGYGIFIYNDGDRFEGEFKDENYHGQGTFYYADGTTVTGEWKDGEIWNGKGRYLFDNGFYDGKFTNGKFDGHGILSLNDGDRFEGEYKDDERNGYGVYTSKDGSRYEGEYKDDKMHGHGTFYYADGTTLTGEWKDDDIWNGKGIYLGDNGNRYEGEFKGGKCHGHGTFYYADGTTVTGEWKDDMPWNGTKTLASGKVRKIKNGRESLF